MVEYQFRIRTFRLNQIGLTTDAKLRKAAVLQLGLGLRVLHLQTSLNVGLGTLFLHLAGRTYGTKSQNVYN